MNVPYDETNPPVQNTPCPERHYYQGHESLATASLVMGILSLVFLCCLPPVSFFFGSLGLLLGALSKGAFTRPKNAKVGTGLSAAAVSIVLIICIFAFSFLLATPNGREALQDYLKIFGSGNTSSEDINEFMDKYYNMDPYSDDNSYDYGSDFFDDYNGDYDYDDYGSDGYDNIPYYYEPEQDSGNNAL